MTFCLSIFMYYWWGAAADPFTLRVCAQTGISDRSFAQRSRFSRCAHGRGEIAGTPLPETHKRGFWLCVVNLFDSSRLRTLFLSGSLTIFSQEPR